MNNFFLGIRATPPYLPAANQRMYCWQIKKPSKILEVLDILGKLQLVSWLLATWESCWKVDLFCPKLYDSKKPPVAPVPVALEIGKAMTFRVFFHVADSLGHSHCAGSRHFFTDSFNSQPAKMTPMKPMNSLTWKSMSTIMFEFFPVKQLNKFSTGL